MRPTLAPRSLSSCLTSVLFWAWVCLYCFWAFSPLWSPPETSETGHHTSFPPVVAGSLSPHELWSLREDVRDAFYHAYDSYMTHAYPWDELKPLSCMGRRWDRRERGTLDDSLGGERHCVTHDLSTMASPFIPALCWNPDQRNLAR
jgi:hypothetical protein